MQPILRERAWPVQMDRVRGRAILYSGLIHLKQISGLTQGMGRFFGSLMGIGVGLWERLTTVRRGLFFEIVQVIINSVRLQVINHFTYLL